MATTAEAPAGASATKTVSPASDVASQPQAQAQSVTPTQGGKQPMTAGRARHLANVKKYGQPLPIQIIQDQRFSTNNRKEGKPTDETEKTHISFLSNFIPSILSTSAGGAGSRTKTIIEYPVCIGTFDPVTRSVWVEDEGSKETLFNKGFFGKGSLSRSEPSWKQRRVDLLKGGGTLAAEQMREQRRIARRQFKIDRAQAMLAAAKQAEEIIKSSATTTTTITTFDTLVPPASGQSPSALGAEAQGEEEEAEAEAEEEVDGQVPARPSSPTPSTSTTMTGGTFDPTSLTPQTFLVRPTRPDQNRNRGRKAFKRRPAPPPPTAPAMSADTTSTDGPSTSTAQIPTAVAQDTSTQIVVEEDDEDELGEEDLFDESLVEEMEHLQLSLEEAMFLSFGLGVLKIYDPVTETYPPLGPALLSLLLTPPFGTSLALSTPTPLLPDDPVMVSYVAYHHFRSLGWVVKDGIKFCADWLLYRRGPVFSHSAFACIVIPVYEDGQDRVSSPYGNQDWYEERTTWKWINTVMRVNALVQKTVIAVYVTIPALSSFPSGSKLANGALDPTKNNFGSLLRRYTVREVSLTRFGAARRRD
ncbi:hypothetical protein IAR55_000793 [Kwoniella newhampshirensis]|uniref:tRNA-intron lyase n=1 Tax=Kwoniella newhampshirensis TaxID=1651941 RepID=A0AAW0Z3X2_9TREE